MANVISDHSGRPILEALEPRLLLSTVSWDGGGADLLWHNPLNWSGDTLPGLSDDVLIDVPNGDVIVEILDDVTVRSILGLEGLDIRTATLTVPTMTVSSLCLGDQGILTTAGMTPLLVEVATDLTIEVGGLIVADELGYGPGEGPGAGDGDPGGGESLVGGGGGYGGAGDTGLYSWHSTRYTMAGGPVYGSVTEPLDFGSGGGHEANGGGVGGGAIALSIVGQLTVDGVISADGENGSIWGGGGGSGGSVYIRAGSLSGDGDIRANGGTGHTNHTSTGGGGGGGRIAVYSDTDTFTGMIGAVGGTGYEYGGAGTVYRKLRSENVGTLSTMNDGYEGADTTILYLAEPVDMVVEAGATVVLESDGLGFSNVRIGSGGKLIPLGFTSLVALEVASGGVIQSGSQIPVDLVILGDVTVEVGGLIVADELGYGPGEGPGAGDGDPGGGESLVGGGGGYGGAGDTGLYSWHSTRYTMAGGPVYGSVTEPLDFGSGGGHEANGGGVGGGAIALSIVGQLTVDGVISADGENGSTWGGGGGSGGSVYIRAGSLSGDGDIHANGGTGHTNHTSTGGGGGGGRIAVYCGDYTFIGSITAVGGSGYQAGDGGTLYIEETVSTLPEIEILDITYEVADPYRHVAVPGTEVTATVRVMNYGAPVEARVTLNVFDLTFTYPPDTELAVFDSFPNGDQYPDGDGFIEPYEEEVFVFTFTLLPDAVLGQYIASVGVRDLHMDFHDPNAVLDDTTDGSQTKGFAESAYIDAFIVDDNTAPSDPVFVEAKDPWDAIPQSNPAQTMDLVAHGSSHEITVLYDDPDHNLDKVYLRISGNGGEDDNPQTIRASVRSGGIGSGRLDGEGTHLMAPLVFAPNATANGWEVTWTFAIDGAIEADDDIIIGPWDDGEALDFYAWSTDTVGVESEHIQCDANAEFRGPIRQVGENEAETHWILSSPAELSDSQWIAAMADAGAGLGLSVIAASLGFAPALPIGIVLAVADIVAFVDAWFEQYNPVRILPLTPNTEVREELRGVITGPDEDKFTALTFLDFVSAGWAKEAINSNDELGRPANRLNKIRDVWGGLDTEAYSASFCDGWFFNPFRQTNEVLTPIELAMLDPRLSYVFVPKSGYAVEDLPGWNVYLAGNPQVKWTATCDVGRDADEFEAYVIIEESDSTPEETGAVVIDFAGIPITSEDTSPSTADGTDFGDISVSSIGTFHQYTIRNSHASEDLGLSLESIGILPLSGNGFYVVDQPDRFILGPGEMDTFAISFVPNVNGPQSAVVYIRSSAAQDEPTWFLISGTGTASTVTGLGTPSVVTGSVSGLCFNDINGDGIQDGGDVGLAGVQVYLDLGDNGQRDDIDPIAVTDADGMYGFGGLSDRVYSVTLLGQPGAEIIGAATALATVIVADDNQRHVTAADLSVQGSVHLALLSEEDEPLVELAFGPVAMGGSKTKTFSILNDGLMELVIANPPTMPSNYGVDVGSGGNWLVLQPGQQAAVGVIFTPSIGGTVLGTLLLETNAPNAPTASIALSGHAGAQVQTPKIFYNDSHYDYKDPLANLLDDLAIATDKEALLPGETATFANYTSYSRGINGVMIDIAALGGTPMADDFVFKVGSDDNPNGWPELEPHEQPSVTVRPTVGGYDRVTLIWADNAIQNEWLEVTVLATANTGLAADDVFYFANLVGDCDGDGEVGSSDYGEFVGEFGLSGGIGTLTADFNADGRVDLTDFATVRGRFGNTLSAPAPAAPGAVVESGLGVVAVAAAATLVDPDKASDQSGRLATGHWQLATGENLTVKPYGNGVARRHVIAARACRTPNNDPAADATGALPLRGADDLLGDDLLVDLLKEAVTSQLTASS